MNCNCITELDEKLKDKNLTITGVTLLLPDFKTVPVIACGWLRRQDAPKGKRNNPPPLIASHCPFCGEKVTLT
jgi:hypothetical protein